MTNHPIPHPPADMICQSCTSRASVLLPSPAGSWECRSCEWDRHEAETLATPEVTR